MTQLKSVFLFTFICFTYICASPGDKSREKCKEYAKYVYTIEESPVLTRRSYKDKVSQCGIVEVPLVIGGVEATPKEFPHMAVIGYGNSPNDPNLAWRCGGSLISEKFVLTASHCLQNQGGSPQKVRLGEVDINSNSESETQDRNIKTTIKHPQYRAGKKYHDIALIEMDSPVKFTGYVRPACLHAEQNIKETRVIAAGFGKTNFDHAEGSKKLMKVNLNKLINKNCEKYFKSDISNAILNNGITNDMICAGELKGGKDTCQGDSGGPLQVVLAEPYCMYDLIGVVSFGKFCGFANQPAIYTNVAAYISWIEKNVWP